VNELTDAIDAEGLAQSAVLEPDTDHTTAASEVEAVMSAA
jgi:hypothetical protein